MEKKVTPKKSTSKKTTKAPVKTATKPAVKKKAQVVKTTTKKAPVKKVNKAPRQDANTGYLLGLTSLVAWVVPVIGAIVTVTGIYCCYRGFKGRKNLALIGLILNIFFLGLSLINVSIDAALMR